MRNKRHILPFIVVGALLGASAFGVPAAYGAADAMPAGIARFATDAHVVAISDGFLDDGTPEGFGWIAIFIATGVGARAGSAVAVPPATAGSTIAILRVCRAACWMTYPTVRSVEFKDGSVTLSATDEREGDISLEWHKTQSSAVNNDCIVQARSDRWTASDSYSIRTIPDLDTGPISRGFATGTVGKSVFREDLQSCAKTGREVTVWGEMRWTTPLT